jgi:sphingomyelin phosphodiesterase
MLSAKLLLVLLLFCKCVVGSVVDDMIHAFQSAVDCAGCHSLLAVLQGVAILGDSVFSNTLVGICETLRVSPAFLRYTMCSTRHVVD